MNELDFDNLTFVINYFDGVLDTATWQRIKNDVNAPVWAALYNHQQQRQSVCACGKNPACQCPPRAVEMDDAHWA